jgi:hypothetical protein
VHGVVRWRIIDLGLGRIRDQRVEADAQSRAAGDGLPQAVGAPTPSRPGGGPSRRSKKLAGDSGDDRAPAGPRSHQHRDLVRRRSQDWPEEQDHPPLGQARQPSLGALRPAQRSTYIFGAICPKQGKAVGLILPWCNTAMMNLHLAAISADVAPGRQAVLLLDQAGWHLSSQLAVPDNITIVPLPPKCPELNAQENVWQFMRDNWLSNRLFDSIDALLDHCCDAWNKLAAQPWTIMSIGLRDWAHGF